MKKTVLLWVTIFSLMSASTLSQLMARYKRAPESQRYKIMNQIKREIARLNRARQHKAIRQLRLLTQSGTPTTSRRSKRRPAARSHPSPMDILNDHDRTSVTPHRTHTPSRSVPARAADTARGFLDGFGGMMGTPGSQGGGHSSGQGSSGHGASGSPGGGFGNGMMGGPSGGFGGGHGAGGGSDSGGAGGMMSGMGASMSGMMGGMMGGGK